MTPDNELLRRYVEQRDEPAFAEIVRRHLNMSYACAARQLNNDMALAQDVTQGVFTDLARKAASLRTHPTLAGWLHTSVRFAAAKAARAEQTRRTHEQTIAMTDQTTEREVCWAQLRPLLDEAVGQLREAERNALLLRFFEEKSHREIGAVLGVSEGAAQMRVERALEKLRQYFIRRGVTAGAALLASTFEAQAASVTAPVTFAATVTGQALTGVGSATTTGTTSAGLWAFFATKTFAGMAALLVAVLVVFWVISTNTTGRNEPALAGSTPHQNSTPATQISNQPPPPPQPVPTMTTSQLVNPRTIVVPLLAAASVATAQPPPPPPPPPPPAPDIQQAGPYAPPVAPPEPPIVVSSAMMALAQDNNQFALDLYHQFNPSANDNAFFSPFSISTALAMTTEGAQGDTAAQMARVLHLTDLSPDTMPPAFGTLQQALFAAEARSGVELYIANSLWTEQNPEHPLLASYLNEVQDKNNFDSVIFPVDFIHNAADAATRINKWVSDNTKGKIEDVLQPGDLNTLTRLVLVNAIYFKGAWTFPFQPRRTIEDQFHLADGSSKPVELMHATFPGFEIGGYADISDASVPFQILSLNYFAPTENNNPADQSRRVGPFPNPMSPEGRLFSFIVLLPRAADGLAALEKSLTANQFSTFLGRLTRNTPVEVFLPKFKLNERYNLNEPLQAMGMSNAFINPNTTPGPAADFSNMDGARDLYIGLVIHQTFLDVDENGTEAAAATVVGMLGGAGRVGAPQPTPVFRADHPFLFLIRDNTTGSILFLGRLANPE